MQGSLRHAFTQELPQLHAVQAFVGSVFEEMPVHVDELLQAAA